ncbi:hypothetical protein NDU88_009046 [Pleurodeles waltl]|uniref:Uncharacterized protein n=1 Tax=Pleurodeles waltl TaxID=8319 RepID=A0AAV7PRB6_PLEWA|nr:hypothetical protein NDU88_009046 [Pleurodeles waltl]
MESPDEADDADIPLDAHGFRLASLLALCPFYTVYLSGFIEDNKQVKYRNTLRWIPYFIYGDEDEAMAAVADPVSHRLYGGTVGDSFLIF